MVWKGRDVMGGKQGARSSQREKARESQVIIRALKREQFPKHLNTLSKTSRYTMGSRYR